jgi:aspartyl-tRNA(Asn)/glutamyl-tRNA(Gln) amidotransferase subunit A
VGFKPSFGRVPVDPPYYGRAAGPMTRTVEDCALMMREIARPDPRDSMSLPAQDIPWRDLALDLEGVRIGLHLDAGVGLEPEPEVRAAIEAAGQLFAEAGARVEPFRPFLTRAMLDGLDRFWRQRAWSDIGALPEATRAKILPFILAWAKGGASLSGAEVYAGMSQMMVMRLAANAAFAEVDYVISPVSPVLGFPAENASPLNDPERPFEHIGFTVPYNMSEQPAVAVPAAMSSQGVPIGLQIAGRRFDDIGVLRLAHAFERLREPLPPYPSLDRAADMTLH